MRAPSKHSLPDVVRRTHDRVGTQLIVANVVGALAVFSYLHLTDSGQIDREIPLVVQVALLVGQLGVLIPVTVWWGHTRFFRAVAWLLEERPITPDEREWVLREPWKQAMRPLVCWLGAAASWGVLAGVAGSEAREVVRIVDAIALGGLTTCALAFLLLEVAFRPLFAVALDGAPLRRPSTLGLRPRLLLAWGAGSGIPLLGLAIGGIGEDVPAAATTALAVFGIAAGLLAIVIVAHSVAAPLDEVRDGLAKVRDGDLEVTVVVNDGGEVGEVQAGFNRMVAGMRERARLEDLFGRHVGEEVAAQALEEGTRLGGEQRDASAVFVDLIGSTAMSEVLPPTEVVRMLNDFFGVVVRAVTTEGGWVNKFEGDGALCVFGVPGVQPDHAARALRAARRVQWEMARLADLHPGLRAGIGVSSGNVVAGNVGTERRYEYTVIGPAVNVAARLTDVAKGRDNTALAASASVERAGDEAQHWRGVGTVAIRGRGAPIPIYEPRSPLPSDQAVDGLGRGVADG